MIFRNKALMHLKHSYIFTVLLFSLVCNRNPVDSGFGNRITKDTQPREFESIRAIGQSVDGKTFGIDDFNVFQILNDNTQVNINFLTTEFFRRISCSDVFINDKKGSLIYSVNTELIRAGESAFDTIGQISDYDSQFDRRYSVDDTKNIWFTNKCDSGVILLRWDGEYMQDYFLNVQDSTNKPFEVNEAWIAAGGGFVYLVYTKSVSIGFNSYTGKPDTEEQIIAARWDQQNNLINYFDRRWWPEEQYMQAAFVAKNELLIAYNYSGWEQGLFLMPFFDTINYSLNRLVNYTANVHLLKLNAEETYLYWNKSIFKITDKITEKNLYSDCGALFLDTSNAVVLFDRYYKKFVNVSNLPGFRNNP
jgi:hypothetical protein